MEVVEVSKLFSVQDKVILVTGGGTGIGKMITEGFIRNGAKVYIASRSLEKCQSTADELNAQGHGTCIALRADLSTEAGCTALAKQLIAKESRLDVLVNNSGIGSSGPIESFTDAVWDPILNLNLKAYYYLARDLLPLLDVAAIAKGGARIINVGSTGGLEPTMLPAVPYDASKAAVHHMTRSLAAQFARRPNGGAINVNAIAPGIVATDPVVSELKAKNIPIEAVDQGIPLRRHARGSDMAGVTLFLASEASEWVTGDVIAVDGGETYAKVALSQ